MGGNEKSRVWSDLSHDHEANSLLVIVAGREARQCQVCGAFQFYRGAGETDH